MAAIEPTHQPTGRVVFSQTEAGSRTVYEAPGLQQSADGRPMYEGRVLKETVTHPGMVVYGPMSTDVVERRGDVYYREEYADLIAAPAPTKVVNAPPPFGYNGVIYEKGQHKGQATPAPAPIVHKEATEYGERIMYTPIEGYSIPAQGVSTEDGFPSRVISKTVYPSRVVHDGSNRTDPRIVPIAGIIPAGGAVSQHGYVEPGERYTTIANERRTGGLEAAAASRTGPEANGMPWQRDFSKIPPVKAASVPWKEVLYAQVPQERLIGMHIPPMIGLKIRLSEQGKIDLKNDELGPRQTQGRPGVITQIHPDGDAVMVMWDAVRRHEEAESGWYRIGAYGQYALCIHSTGNRDEEIEARAERVKYDGPLQSDIREIGFGW